MMNTSLSLTGSSPDSSPTRLPIRQKGSQTVPLLPPLEPLPALPVITDSLIRQMALTHASSHSSDKRRNRELIMDRAEAVLDYEKLEHVGDGILTASVITLLHDRYPAFGAGPATYLRGHMVSNRTLAQIAEQYAIPQLVIAEQHSKYMLQAGEKVKGSLFEAYVAGVYYSYLQGSAEGSEGERGPCTEDKGERAPVTTSSETEGNQPTTEVRARARTHGEAFDYINSWLWPLFTPVAEFLKGHLQAQSAAGGTGGSELKPIQFNPNIAIAPEEWKVEDARAAGSVSALNQLLGKSYGCGVLPTWLTKHRGNQVWKMTCMVVTPEGKEFKAEAKRLTKRGAMAVAAYHVWQQLKAWEEAQRAKREAEQGSDEDEVVVVIEEMHQRATKKTTTSASEPASAPSTPPPTTSVIPPAGGEAEKTKAEDEQGQMDKAESTVEKRDVGIEGVADKPKPVGARGEVGDKAKDQ